MAEQPAPPAESAAAPAPSSSDTRTFELGPNADIYPESVREPQSPVAETEDDDDAPDATETAASEQPADAGSEQKDTRSSRRRGAEEAYQRGLAEGRDALVREQADNYQRESAQRIQQEANQRIQSLMDGLRSPDGQVRDRSGRELASIFDSNRAGQAALSAARQEIVREMAQDFESVRKLQGVDEATIQAMLQAPTAAAMASVVHSAASKAAQERITALEAELSAARARMVGSAATPERANGAGSIGAHNLADMQRLPPKEWAQLPKAQYDAAVAAYFADKAAGR